MGQQAGARLKVVPIHLRVANTYIKEHHRHHGPVVGHTYAVAVANEDHLIRGVAIVGRPPQGHEARFLILNRVR